MLTITSAQLGAMSTAAGGQFVDRVLEFLETDYPEAAGADLEAGRRVARGLIDQAGQFGLHSQEGVLRFVSMYFDYFVHEPRAFAWAHQLLSDPDLPERQKLMGLEQRLYGVPLWG
ncbi:hypothetical protein BurJ1DRAFT_4412 [Burkholderiales bacterium JOSHI_001]|nr:hypothetical protein BurJ1DRAFT_4412 [Burkholderiales bacterium JOSHI_001]